ncbi:unnamed protein product, partial [marine sediment metagenome]
FTTENVKTRVACERRLAIETHAMMPDPPSSQHMMVCGNTVTFVAISTMIGLIEELGFGTTSMFINRARVHDFRILSRDLVTPYPKEFSISSGIQFNIEGVDVVVLEGIHKDTFILCASVDNLGKKLDEPVAFVFHVETLIHR